MPRSPIAIDFVVNVEGEGTFSFAKRTMRDQVSIEVEYARLTEGLEVIPQFLHNLATKMADLKVLTVQSPEGWNVDDLDPLDDTSGDRLVKVWSALRDKEISFRGGAKPAGQGQGTGPIEDPGVLVPEKVQPGAN